MTIETADEIQTLQVELQFLENQVRYYQEQQRIARTDKRRRTMQMWEGNRQRQANEIRAKIEKMETAAAKAA